MDDQGVLAVKKDQLWVLAERFIDTNTIGSEECVYQNDHVIESAYDFIAEICDIVGYKPYEEDE